MRKIVFIIFALLAITPTTPLLAQTVVNAPKVVIVPKPAKPPKAKEVYKQANNVEIPVEKFLLTDAKVNITIPCVSEGMVKINGWDRSEIRAYVSGGSNVGFSVRDKNKQSGKPNLVTILGTDPSADKGDEEDECLSGDEIELDVPRGATVSLVGRGSDISIASVNKVKVENDGGDISLSEIARGIYARTYQGVLMVEKSSGSMTLLNTNGNIVVFATESDDVGDVLTAKTSSGTITLQQVAQKQISASSNTGSIRFNGEFENGGQYSFGTTNGSINLLIPAESSCKIEAFYGGSFQSEIPLKIITKDINPQVQKINAIFGAGDSNLTLKTIGGAINIRKNNPK